MEVQALFIRFLAISLLFISCSKEMEKNFAADGNSYVQGNGYKPFTRVIEDQLNTSVKNFGVSGQSTAHMLTDQQTQVLNTFVNGQMNVLLVVEGGNDVYLSGRVDSAVMRYKRYCQNARAKGWKVIVSTTIPRKQPSSTDSENIYNLKLKQFNAAITEDTSFCDGVIRPDLETIFSTFSAPGYAPDGVHPNTIGQEKFAELFIAAIGRL